MYYEIPIDERKRPAMKKNRVELYFPTKRGNGHPIPTQLYEDWLKAAKLLFYSSFGGYTLLRGSGGYWSQEHNRLIEEDVFVFYAYCSDEELCHEGVNDLHDFALKLKENLIQECVAIVINNTMEFIS